MLEFIFGYKTAANATRFNNARNIRSPHLNGVLLLQGCYNVFVEVLGQLSMAEADFGLKPLGVNFHPILGIYQRNKSLGSEFGFWNLFTRYPPSVGV